MGRRRRNSYLDDFIQILGAIVSTPYGYVIGIMLTLVLLGISELWMVPPSPTELGPYTHGVENMIKPFQWFVRFLAVCSFIATLVNFWSNER